ncbi:MAG: hypothetical protein ACRD0U_00420 [Acidimicrobiales bacterium]
MSETMESGTGSWRIRDRWLEVILQCGLTGVFLVNGLTALLQPDDFAALVEDSALGRWLDIETRSWLGPLIAANDLVLCVALLSGIWLRRCRVVVLAWAGVWLLAVTAIRMTALDAFPW